MTLIKRAADIRIDKGFQDFDFSILQAHQVLPPLRTTTHYPYKAARIKRF